MKKLIAAFLLIPFFGFDCSCSSCLRRCAFDRLSDDLFNKNVLEFYDIPWLKKPENITKKSVETRDKRQHIYYGYIQDEQSFWDYGEYIYNQLVEKEYTIGAYVAREFSGAWDKESWYLIKKPTSYEDCVYRNISYPTGDIRKVIEMDIYYSVKGVDNEYNSKKGGYEMLQPRRIGLSLGEVQDGSWEIVIGCLHVPDDVFFLEI